MRASHSTHDEASRRGEDHVRTIDPRRGARAPRLEPARPPSDVRHGHGGPLPVSVRNTVSEPGRPLDRGVVDPLERRLAHDFSQVRIHTDAEAGRSAREVGARAYTVGRDVVFGDGAYRPSTPSGRQLLVHELTHVVEQSPDAGAGAPGHRDGIGTRVPFGALQRDELADLPAAERRGIHVSTVPVVVPTERVTAFFSVNDNGRHGETQTLGGTTTVFGPGVPERLQTGLGSVGAWLGSSTNALPLGSTIEVELDLTPYGGGRQRIRYTRSTRRSGRGARANESPRLLVDVVGSAVATTLPQQAPSSVQVGGTSFTLSGSWSPADVGALDQALRLLPPAALSGAAGLAFHRRSGDGPGAEGGHFDAERDRIVLYDNAFPVTSLRVGGHGLGVRTIVHEVGHALDLRPLERAWQAFDSAGQTSGASSRLVATRSASGSRWVRGATGEFQQESAMADIDGAFRRAVQGDGVRRETAARTTPEGVSAGLRGGVTGYADVDYQELFAESFAVYVSDPDTLRALRPATYAWFAREYPRSSVAASP